MAAFNHDDKIVVSVSSWDSEDNDRCLQVAQALSRPSETLLKLLEKEREVRALEAQLRHLKSQQAPAEPARLLGVGCARFDQRGRLWLLDKQESGWAAFGFVFDSWDELFRRYDVRVVGHGGDILGPYWLVESTAADRRAA